MSTELLSAALEKPQSERNAPFRVQQRLNLLRIQARGAEKEKALYGLTSLLSGDFAESPQLNKAQLRKLRDACYSEMTLLAIRNLDLTAIGEVFNSIGRQDDSPHLFLVCVEASFEVCSKSAIEAFLPSIENNLEVPSNLPLSLRFFPVLRNQNVALISIEEQLIQLKSNNELYFVQLGEFAVRHGISRSFRNARQFHADLYEVAGSIMDDLTLDTIGTALEGSYSKRAVHHGNWLSCIDAIETSTANMERLLDVICEQQ